MGRQVNYYLTPNDMKEAEQRIRSCTKILFFQDFTISREPVLLESLHINTMEKENLRVFAVHPSDVGKIIFKYIETQHYYTVDLLCSPVLEVTRCYFHNGILRRGRMFADTWYYENNIKITKDENFVNWVKAVYKALKRGLKQGAEVLQNGRQLTEDRSIVGTEAERLRLMGACVFTPF